jgi:uncharacterized OB-fold protein
VALPQYIFLERGYNMLMEYVVYSFTVIRTSSEEFQEMTPYVCGLLEDQRGKRKVVYMGHYDESKPIQIGRSVVMDHVDPSGIEVYRQL